jgi:serine protease Do
MNTRSRTIASFFSVAMAAMLFGAVVTNQIQRPTAAQARNPDPAGSPAPVGPGGSITLDTFKEISRRQTAGVVNIGTKKVVRRSRGGADQLQDLFGDDFMERFFGPQGPGGGSGNDAQTQRSLGSGFVVDKDGTILTNRHVVDGADEITVSIGRRDYVAKLIGKDARTDVALLKIDAKEPLTVLSLGDSDQTEVGEWVMAIGNPFGLGGNSVTVGVVSYKGRAIPLGVVQGTSVDMIQTDAAINPGNSGGPLLNTRGEVIGINTLIITRGMPQSAGVGFAVPINVAKEILPQLRERGRVVRGWLGVQIQALTEDMARTYRMKDNKGALISDVTADSPAEKAGLKADDVVIAVDGRAIEDNGDLSRYIASKAPGTTVNLRVLRAGGEQTIAVLLGTFPDETVDSENDSARHGQLGMALRNLTPDTAERLELPRTTKGVVVSSVEAGEAAEEAGLARLDVILSVNGAAVGTVAEFEREIDRARPDGVARLRVRRPGGYSFLVLKLK